MLPPPLFPKFSSHTLIFSDFVFRYSNFFPQHVQFLHPVATALGQWTHLIIQTTPIPRPRFQSERFALSTDRNATLQKIIKTYKCSVNSLVNMLLRQINMLLPEMNMIPPEMKMLLPEMKMLLPEIGMLLPKMLLPEINMLVPEMNMLLLEIICHFKK